jgi:hypothetical protein
MHDHLGHHRINPVGRVMEIRVGPPNLTIHADEQFLVCAPDASMAPQHQQGYSSSDTRIASLYQLTLADTPPTLLNSMAGASLCNARRRPPAFC